MSKGETLEWGKAYSLAEEMKNKMLANSRCIAMIDVCGSIRRRKERVGDIDFAIIAETEEYDKVWDAVPSDCQFETRGSVSRRGYWKGMKFDFRLFKYKQRGAAILTRTGPAKFNINMRGIAKRRGYKLNEYGLENKNGICMSEGWDEEKYFQFLGLKYLKPEERGGPLVPSMEEPKVTRWEVPSSSGNGTYTIVLKRGDLTCTCPGFKYRGHCRHTDAKAGELAFDGHTGNPSASRKRFEKPIYVNCVNCGYVRENEVEFLNISEDWQGYDEMQFRCPTCGATQKSRRYG